MSDLEQLDPAYLDALVERLEHFPANGKPPSDETTTSLILLRFVESMEVKKPCRECGVERHDYSYLRITNGGKHFLAASLRARKGEG